MLSDQLSHGSEQLGLHLTNEQHDKLLAYIALLAKWNKVYNLTAIKLPELMVSHHLLDSLVLSPLLEQRQNRTLATRVIDVGTGAGLPGIPLSIVLPEYHFCLLDSNGKKSRFLTQAKIELELENCTPVNERIECYQPEEKYDIVMSRAFSSLIDFFTLSRHLLKSNGEYWAMKGKYPKDELKNLTSDYKIQHIQTLSVPTVDKERHLLIATHQFAERS
jgi:16S rRNA (guanine527-N7)-methyltransferase